MSTYSLSDNYADYPYPWDVSVFGWDRQGVIREGTEQYLLIKVSSGGLQNGVPAPLLAYKVSTSGFIDYTTQIFGKIPQFSITRELIVKDINGDGFDDIFLSNQGPEPTNGLFPGEQNAIYIYQPTTKTFKEIITPGSDFSHGSAIGDFDGDGRLDIFVNNLGSTSGIRSYVLKQESDGTFTNKSLAESFLNTVGPLNAAIDINKDGKSELAGIDQNGSLVIWQNIMGSSPTKMGNPVALPTSAKGIFEIRSADLDGNGKSDIVVTGTDDGITSSNGVTLGGILKAAIIFDAGLPSQRLVDPLKAAGINLICQGGVEIELINFDNSGVLGFELRTYDSSWRPQDFTVYVDVFGNTKVADTSALISAVKAVYIDANGDGALDLVANQNFKLRVRFGVLSNDSAAIATKINGTPDNDRISGTQGNDIIDGGAGIDTLSYIGPRGSYTSTPLAGGFTVSSSTEGMDTLTSIERLKFSDCNLGLDLGLTQSAGETALLLGTVLPGKLALDASKQPLIGTVIGLFDSGYSVPTLSGALLRLDVWSILTGQSIAAASRSLAQDTAIVNYLMTNVNGVAPDAANLKANADVMHNEASQGTWLAQLALSTAAQNHIGLVGLAATGIVYL